MKDIFSVSPNLHLVLSTRTAGESPATRRLSEQLIQRPDQEEVTTSRQGRRKDNEKQQKKKKKKMEFGQKAAGQA